MRRALPTILALVASGWVATGCDGPASPSDHPKSRDHADSGTPGAPDSGPDDTAPADDTARVDTGTIDTGTIDTGTIDTGAPLEPAACPDAVATCADNTCTFDINLVGVALGGTLTYEGGALPDSGDGSGSDYLVWVVNQSTGGETSEAFVFDQLWSLTLPVGTYDVYAQLLVHGRESHMGAAVKIADDLVLATAATLDADLVPTSVGGQATLAGGAIPDSRDDADYAVRLVDAEGNEVEGAFGASDPWSLLVPAGHYDAWTRIYGGSSDAQREWTWSGDFDVTADTVYDIDATFPLVTGHPTLDGSDLVDARPGPDEDYRVQLTEVTTRQGFEGAFPHDEDGKLEVPAGIYDMELLLWLPSAVEGSSYLEVRSPALSLLADSALDLAVTTITVGGTVTLDGADVPDTAYDLDYCVLFTATDGGAVARTCGAAGDPWAARIPSGNYDIDVKLAGETGDATGGRPAHRVASGVEVGDGSHFSFDVGFATLSGRVSYAGGPMPNPMADPREAYTVAATDVETGSTYSEQFPFSQPFSLSVPTGIYDVEVRIDDRGASKIVTETFVAAESLVVAGNTSLYADMPVVLLVGEVRYQGFLVNTLARHDFGLSVRDDGDFNVSRDFPAAEGYALRLWPGTYEVWAGLEGDRREGDLDAGVRVARCLLVEP